MIQFGLLFCIFLHSLAYAAGGSGTDEFQIGANTDQEKVLKFGIKKDSPVLVVDEKDRILKYRVDPLSPLAVGFTNSEKEYNVITTNPNFELGKVGWVASDSSTFSIRKDNPLFGSSSGVFQATRENQYIETIPYEIPVALRGKPCGLTFYYKSSDENYKVMLVSEQGEMIAGTEQTLRTFLTPNKTTVSFNCPSDKKIKVRIASSTQAAPIVVDRFFLGEKEPPVIVPEKPVVRETMGFYGSLTFLESRNCTWSIQGTDWKVPPENANCPDPIVKGKAKSAGKIPAVRFPSMPPGLYLIIVHAQLEGSNRRCLSQFTDGTSIIPRDVMTPTLIVTEMEYTTTEDRVFSIQMRVGVSNPGLSCEMSSFHFGQPFTMSVYRFSLN